MVGPFLPFFFMLFYSSLLQLAVDDDDDDDAGRTMRHACMHGMAV